MADVALSVFDWIANQDYGFNRVSDEERKLASDFAILWTYFEAQVCDTEATPPKLKALAREIGTAEALDPAPIQDAMAHFRNRYIQNGEPSHHFTDLHFLEKYAQPVWSILASDYKDMATELEAALLIVHRYRNNLFHGVKWAYSLRGQEDNFSHAIQLLKAIIRATIQVRGGFRG